MRKKIFLFLLLLFPNSLLFAQIALDAPTKKQVREENKQERLSQTDSYFVLEAIGTYRSAQDLATSNQIYDGFGGGLGFGGYRTYDKNIHRFQGRGGYNALSSQAGVGAHDIWSNFNYTYLRRINDNSKYDIFLGGQADILSQVRITTALSNSSLHWEVIGSLGLAARIQSGITLPWIHKKVQVFGQAHLPLLAYINRPIYGVTVSGEIQQYVRPIGRFARAQTELGMTFNIRKDNSNLFRLAYQWEMLRWRDNEVYKVVTGQHYLSFALLVKMR